MNEAGVHVRSFPISINDVDFARQLKLSALFNYCQQAAISGAELLGLGMAAMEEEYGAAFILTRVRTEVVRPPRWGETISVETWPQPPGRLEFERDYLVLDEEGKVVARAISGWILMDIVKRRIKRPNIVKQTFPLIARPRPFSQGLERLQHEGEPAPAYSLTIGYSAIDMYGHLNNTKYVDAIMDCFPMEVHRHWRVGELDLDFVNETLPGDSLILRKESYLSSPPTHYIEGVRESDGRVAFRARLVFVNRCHSAGTVFPDA